MKIKYCTCSCLDILNKLQSTTVFNLWILVTSLIFLNNNNFEETLEFNNEYMQQDANHA